MKPGYSFFASAIGAWVAVIYAVWLGWVGALVVAVIYSVLVILAGFYEAGKSSGSRQRQGW